MEPIQFYDRAEIPTGIKRDAAGNLIVPPARVCKTGIYDYAGYELGKPEMRTVRVYRPAEEVFNRDAMRTLAGAPVTIGHPKELVGPQNWQQFAKGETASDDIVRDGESIRVPFILRDAGAIIAVEEGTVELSPGYTAVIDWTAGQTPEGKEYDAVARTIRYNHLAIVDRARGGSECRIGDKLEEEDVATKMVLVDGLSVETTDAGEIAILKLVDERKQARDKVSDLETKLADADKAKGEAEGQVVALKKQLEDATNPDALSKAAAARAKLCDQAKAIVPKLVTDNKSDTEIRKEVVAAKLGDVASGMTDDQIAGAFVTLAATAKAGSKDQISDALRHTQVSDGDGGELVKEHRNARQAMLDRFRSASQPKAEADKE